LAGDTVYGAVRLLKWLVDRQIAPHIPVWDKSARTDGTFSRADFVFDRSRNVYLCPNGKLLHTTGTVIDGAIAMSARSRRSAVSTRLRGKFPRGTKIDLCANQCATLIGVSGIEVALG